MKTREAIELLKQERKKLIKDINTALLNIRLRKAWNQIFDSLDLCIWDATKKELEAVESLSSGEYYVFTKNFEWKLNHIFSTFIVNKNGDGIELLYKVVIEDDDDVIIGNYKYTLKKEIQNINKVKNVNIPVFGPKKIYIPEFKRPREIIKLNKVKIYKLKKIESMINALSKLQQDKEITKTIEINNSKNKKDAVLLKIEFDASEGFYYEIEPKYIEDYYDYYDLPDGVRENWELAEEKGEEIIESLLKNKI